MSEFLLIIAKAYVLIGASIVFLTLFGMLATLPFAVLASLADSPPSWKKVVLWGGLLWPVGVCKVCMRAHRNHKDRH